MLGKGSGRGGWPPSCGRGGQGGGWAEWAAGVSPRSPAGVLVALVGPVPGLLWAVQGSPAAAGVSRTRPGAICPPALPELSCCSLQRFQGGSPLLPASTAEVKSEHLRVENSYIKINKMVPRVFI